MKPENYELIISEDFLCVATVLEIILKAEGFSSISRFQIASWFGLCLPDGFELKYDFLEKGIFYSKDANQWGIRIKNDSLNEFFSANNLPFQEKYFPINQIADFSFLDDLRNVFANSRHTIVGFDYGKLFREERNLKIGHVGIVTQVVDEENCLLLDPGPRNPGLKKVSLEDLFDAIRSKKDGIWSINRVPE